MQRHKILRAGLDIGNAVGMEIGPLCSPLVSKSEGDVTYVDWAETAVLVEKYRNDPNVDVDRIVGVDAVWGDQTLLECVDGRKMDYVIASHVGEHVPDLITWLQEIRSVLKPGGQLRLALPDKRFTFDCRRAETDISDLLTAYAVKARRPQIREVVDFKVHVSLQADGRRIFRGEQNPAEVTPIHTIEEVMLCAEQLLNDPSIYLDVHCWVFTPRRFAELMARLSEYGLIDLACAGFVDTKLAHVIEFYVFLRPAAEGEDAAASWRSMAMAARDPLPGSAAAAVTGRSGRQRAGGADAAHDAAALRYDLATARDRIAAVAVSTAWRITATMRAVATKLRLNRGR